MLNGVRFELAASVGALARVPLWVIAGLACFVIYCYKPFIQSSMDNQPLRLGALLLARDATLDFSATKLKLSEFYSFRVHPDGRISSHTPIGTAIYGALFFVFARVCGVRLVEENVVYIDSFAASALTALSACMASWLTRRQGRAASLFIGLACGLATASWSTASRCMWQHTGAQFSLFAALCLLDGERKPVWRVVFGALMLGMTVWCRPYLAPACAIVLAFEVRHSRRAMIGGAAAGLAALLLWMACNLVLSGTLFGTYISVSTFRLNRGIEYWDRLWGSLVSPNRGMFVFSPLMLMAASCVPYYLWKWKLDPRMTMLALAASVAILGRGFLVGWHGGHSYGARTMLDSTPFLLLLMSPLAAWMLTPRRAVSCVPIGLFALSAAIQFLGVARDYESWNIAMRMNMADNAWNWRKPQILHCLTNGEWTRGPLLQPAGFYYSIPADGVIKMDGRLDNPFLRYGFSELAAGMAWAMPPRAGLAVYLPAQVAVQLKIDLLAQPFPLDPTVIGVYWNGHKAGDIAVYVRDPEFNNMPIFRVPVEYVRAGLNTIELRVSRVYYKDAGSSPMGALVDKVIVRPAGR
ncbi:MAG: hypothetical protein NTY46_07585 [Candidatus Sumerlaeota bacterium]|nr:hypothetical protein [Candidatus Sumerlaeota bacterium]